MLPISRFAATLLAVLLAAAPSAAFAQSRPADPEARAALATVERLFDAMRAGDTASIRSVFMPGAVLMSVGARPDGRLVDTTTIDAFVTSIGGAASRQPPVVLDERLFNTEVRVDGSLASVWTEYDFYAGPRFSHCGVDAVQLARTPDGWRIFHLADTRRREGCPRSPSP